MNDQPGPWDPPTEPTPSAPTPSAPNTPGMPPQPGAAPNPPEWAPPGAPHEPPTAPVPPIGPPPADPPPLGGSTAGWGPPPVGTTGPAVATAPGPAPGEPSPSSGNRAGLLVGLIVLAVLVLGGVLAAVLVLSGGGTEIGLDIERCEIAADGSLTASGTVTNPDDGTVDVPVEVTFVEVDGGATVDEDRLELSVPGGAAERWSASGTAGDDVQQVNCEVTAG